MFSQSGRPAAPTAGARLWRGPRSGRGRRAVFCCLPYTVGKVLSVSQRARARNSLRVPNWPGVGGQRSRPIRPAQAADSSPPSQARAAGSPAWASRQARSSRAATSRRSPPASVSVSFCMGLSHAALLCHHRPKTSHRENPCGGSCAVWFSVERFMPTSTACPFLCRPALALPSPAGQCSLGRPWDPGGVARGRESPGPADIALALRSGSGPNSRPDGCR